MNKNMQKFLALAVCAVMLLGILVGCNSDTSNDPSTGSTGENHTTPEIIGTFMLNVNACIDISYDAEGRVLNLQEVDSDAHELLADYAGYLENACTEVVADLVAISIEKQLMSAEVNDIVIKQAPGAKLPSEDFLTNLAAEAEKAAEIKVDITVITEAEQDQEGNINADKAQELLQKALNVDSFDYIDGSDAPIDGTYAYAISVDSLSGDYLVEASTGYVYEGTPDNYDFESDEPIDETEEDVEEEDVSTTQETTQQTDAALPEDTVEDSPESAVEDE